MSYKYRSSNSSQSQLPAIDNIYFNHQNRQGRLFSNPFGILGHDSCHGDIEGNSLTGVCYNEVECVVRGGTLAGYCGPPGKTNSFFLNLSQN